MKKVNKIFITLASIVSISSLPIVAAACDEKKTEEGTEANSGTKDQKEQTSPKDQKDQTSPKDQKDQTSPKDQKSQTPPKDQKDQTSPKDQKSQTPPKDQKDQTSPKDQKSQTPPKDQKEQSTKKYILPKLKEFLDKEGNELFKIDEKNEEAKKELKDLASEGALRITNGKIQHHSSGKGKKSKQRKQRKSFDGVKHLKLNPTFDEIEKVNTHGDGSKSNIGYNLGGKKKGIKISSKEGNKIVIEWQLYCSEDDGKNTLDDKIYKQEIDLN